MYTCRELTDITIDLAFPVGPGGSGGRVEGAARHQMGRPKLIGRLLSSGCADIGEEEGVEGWALL